MSFIRRHRSLLALALLALGVLAALFVLRGSWGRVWGDESTFLAMTESLVADGDLAFTAADKARLEALSDPARQTVILQRTDAGVAYSKPVLYPLLAAPAYALLGDAGLPVTNAALLAGALALAGLFLRRLSGADDWLPTLLTFAGASILCAYVAWAMSDALQSSLALAGLVLAVGGERKRDGVRSGWLDSRWAPLAGGVVLGLVAALRYPNALVGLAAVAALAWRRRFAQAAGLALMMGVGLALASGLNAGLAGAASPYKAVRSSFNETTGYPGGAGESVEDPFEERLATQSMGIKPRFEPRVSAYSALYFLIGRHSGLVAYFPAALLFAWLALRRGDALSRLVLLGAVALAAFYLIWLPRNYFGGATFVGNRYFLVAYPALLVALPRLPGRRALGAAWLAALLVGGSALVSAWGCRGLDRSSQSHAHAGVFRWLPLESTADAIGGLEDRYWSSDFLRFADPYAGPEEWSFELSTEAPAAEVLFGHSRASGILRFLVRSEAPASELVYRDWKGSQSFPLADGGGGSQGVVEVITAPAWRRHSLRWRPERRWNAAVARLSIRTASGQPAQARVRYLGPYRLDRKFFDHATLAAELPTSAPAGGATELALRLRNTGHRPWATRDAVPVELGYWLESIEGDGRKRRGRQQPLPGRVRRAQNVDVLLEVRWPPQPGTYDLEVDLLLGGVVRFAEITGRPLARGRVEVTGSGDAVPDG